MTKMRFESHFHAGDRDFSGTQVQIIGSGKQGLYDQGKFGSFPTQTITGSEKILFTIASPDELGQKLCFDLDHMYFAGQCAEQETISRPALRYTGWNDFRNTPSKWMVKIGWIWMLRHKIVRNDPVAC